MTRETQSIPGCTPGTRIALARARSGKADSMKLPMSVCVLGAVSLLTGCAPSTAKEDVSEDQVVSRPTIELALSGDDTSVQAKLFKLLEAFKDDQVLKIGQAVEAPAFF